MDILVLLHVVVGGAGVLQDGQLQEGVGNTVSCHRLKNHYAFYRLQLQFRIYFDIKVKKWMEIADKRERHR